jgi:hypothetical protein
LGYYDAELLIAGQFFYGYGVEPCFCAMVCPLFETYAIFALVKNVLFGVIVHPDKRFFADVFHGVNPFLFEDFEDSFEPVDVIVFSCGVHINFADDKDTVLPENFMDLFYEACFIFQVMQSNGGNDFVEGIFFEIQVICVHHVTGDFRI